MNSAAFKYITYTHNAFFNHNICKDVSLLDYFYFSKAVIIETFFYLKRCFKCILSSNYISILESILLQLS